MSLSQGGSGFPYLSEAVYQYIATGVYTNIAARTDDIPGAILKFAVKKVRHHFIP